MATLAFTRRGSGAPLVLLHALGSSRRSWDPVIPGLAEHFDVIAVDLPGFGDSEPLPAQVEPHPAALAAAVGGLLDDLGITDAHIAGNSLGGWVALEFARTRSVASLALLSPAGLWKARTPLYCRVSLRITRWLAEHAARPLSRVVNFRVGRLLVLGQTHGRPSRVTPDQARTAIRAMGTSPGFDAALKATFHRCYRSGPIIDASVSVAFGSRDLLLPRRARRLDELPPGTQVGALPACGHLPMSDNPAAVTAFIMASTMRGAPTQVLAPGRRA